MDKSERNIEFFRRLIEAKKMEKEAFGILIPEHIKKHVDVIEKEVQLILYKILCKDDSHEKTKKEERASVKKVNIL